MTDNSVNHADAAYRDYPARWLRRSRPAGEPYSEERAVWVAMNVRRDEGRTITDDEVAQCRAAWHIRAAQRAAGVQPERDVRPTMSATAALARVLRLRR